MNKSLTDEESTNSLLEAFNSIKTESIAEPEYRVYYDPKTRTCLFKTVGLADREKEYVTNRVRAEVNGVFVDHEMIYGEIIVVSQEEYDAIDFCPNFEISLDKKIVRKDVEFCSHTMLSLSNAGHKTIKDNMIFRVDDAYFGDSDYWSIGNTDDFDYK